MGMIRDLFRRKPAPSPSAAPARRGYDGAAINRMTSSWQAAGISIDRELRGQLDLLRHRSREISKNNEFARHFVRMVRRNVVGSNGFMLRFTVEDAPGQQDTAANDVIERAFREWSRKGVCEVSGKYSFTDVQNVLIGSAAVDGEFMVREVRGKAAGNRFNYALQLLNMDRLDTQYNVERTAGGNTIVMGVEMNPFRRPVAYWVFKSHPNGGLTGSRERERIPASEIIHEFNPDEIEQSRGVPWMHASIRRLHDLGGYREAAIIAARIGAANSGFFTTEDGDLTALADNESGAAGSAEPLEMEVEPGVFRSLPAGTDFKPFNPDYPHQQFDMFVKSCLRGVASGFGVSYNALANDLEGVNFSSIRAGVLDERDGWMAIQGWFIESLLNRVTDNWLELSMLSGAITTPTGAALPLAKMEKFRSYNWHGRRWSWVDPLKDINASILAIQNGLTSPQRVAAQMGVDIDDVLTELAQFEAKLKAKGVALAATPATPKPEAPAEGDDSE